MCGMRTAWVAMGLAGLVGEHTASVQLGIAGLVFPVVHLCSPLNLGRPLS